MTLAEAERWRQMAWSMPSVDRAGDWTARPDGVCRNRAAWLRQKIGGTIIYGYRHDDRGVPHAALLIWAGSPPRPVVVDRDKIWVEREWPARRIHDRWGGQA